eukprot:CAMPEP_0167826126 /NCGR_PEP_ID=MMETSP0112_2-20121227/9820_1 /TAXON_ID=91324 /ORGANISM="Lotharella globosa, Strain CCCM811" /LENGTH=81 /DNA_ID=CAMNT_0007728453 /DNA_START=170 /DNA_END=415 /DNA_ORIENTATION=-
MCCSKRSNIFFSPTVERDEGGIKVLFPRFYVRAKSIKDVVWSCIRNDTESYWRENAVEDEFDATSRTWEMERSDGMPGNRG